MDTAILNCSAVIIVSSHWAAIV